MNIVFGNSFSSRQLLLLLEDFLLKALCLLFMVLIKIAGSVKTGGVKGFVIVALDAKAPFVLCKLVPAAFAVLAGVEAAQIGGLLAGRLVSGMRRCGGLPSFKFAVGGLLRDAARRSRGLCLGDVRVERKVDVLGAIQPKERHALYGRKGHKRGNREGLFVFKCDRVGRACCEGAWSDCGKNQGRLWREAFENAAVLFEPLLFSLLAGCSHWPGEGRRSSDDDNVDELPHEGGNHPLQARRVPRSPAAHRRRCNSRRQNGCLLGRRRLALVHGVSHSAGATAMMKATVRETRKYANFQ